MAPKRILSHRLLVSFLVGCCGWLAFTQPARATLLFDGASNVTPNQAPWLWGYQTFNKTNPFIPSLATHSAAGGVTTLNSTPTNADVAGYLTHVPNLFSPGFSYVMPNVQTLDRATGFNVQFTVRVNSETHSSTDRAGFSVIALSSDPTPLGIELAFWTNEVWAQNAGFTHGESSGLFDTTAGLIDYELLVQGTAYQLRADNIQILSGALRNYTAFSGGPPFNTGFPYNQPNFLFFGDDTSSARASIALAEITVDELAAVPEPSTLLLAALALLSLGVYAWRRSDLSTNSAW